MSAHEIPGTTATSAPPVPAEHLRTSRLGLALLVIAAAQVMLVLDNTIMNVALPNIRTALNLADADLNWVITSYALAFGGLLLVGGRAGDLFGRRRVFRVGLVVFTIASLLGGVAWTSGVLIAARTLQGVGAAIAAPTALSLLVTTFPAGPARNKALGVYGAMGGLGSVVGLLLGGTLTQYAGWRWVMFINVPISVLVLIGTRVLRSGDREHGRVAVPGALAATGGLAALVYAINRAATDGWGDTRVLGFVVAAAVLLVAFGVLQRTSSAPMLPGRVLRDRARAGAYLTMFLCGAGMFAVFYFLTLYMQVVKGYSPLRTGLSYLPIALGIGIAAGGVGPQLLARASARAVAASGLVVAALGMAWFSTLSPTSSAIAVLLPAQFVSGFGLGLAFVTVTIVAVRGVAPQDAGIASGVVNTAQQIGGALGLAVLVSVASSITRGALPGDARAALTHGYAAGLLVAGGLFLSAAVVAVATLNVRAGAEQR